MWLEESSTIHFSQQKGKKYDLLPATIMIVCTLYVVVPLQSLFPVHDLIIQKDPKGSNQQQKGNNNSNNNKSNQKKTIEIKVIRKKEM